jgi:hypothetical protein
MIAVTIMSDAVDWMTAFGPCRLARFTFPWSSEWISGK